MGGFTRPRDLRTSMWMPGGPYHRKGKVYESPPEAAYEPHTVYLLESRYPVKFGIGRADSVDHLIGCCTEGDFEAVLKKYNSERAPIDARESMDNALWPWLDKGKYSRKRVKWWDPGENPNAVLKEIIGEDVDSVCVEGVLEEFSNAEGDDKSSVTGKTAAMNAVANSTGDASTEASSSRIHPPSGASQVPPPPASPPRSPPCRVPASTRPDAFTCPAFPGQHHRTFGTSSPSVIIHGENRLIPPLIAENGVPMGTGPPEDEAHIEANDGHTTHGTQYEHPPDFVTSTPGIKRQLHSSSVVRATEVPLPTDDRPSPTHIGQEAPSSSSENSESNSEATPSDTQKDSQVYERRKQYLPTLQSEPFWRPVLSITVSTRPLAATLLRLCKAHPRGLPFYASIHNDDRKYGGSFGSRMRCMRIARMSGLAVEMAELLGGARGGYIGIRFSVKSVGRLLDSETLASPIPWDKRVIKIGVGNWLHRASEIKEGLQLDAKEKIAPIVMGQGEEKDKGPFQTFGLDDWGTRIDDKTGEFIPWPKSKAVYDHEAAAELNRLNSMLEDDEFIDDEFEGDEVVEDMDDKATIAEVKRRRALHMTKRREAKLKRKDISRTYTREIALTMAQRNRHIVSP